MRQGMRPSPKPVLRCVCVCVCTRARVRARTCPRPTRRTDDKGARSVRRVRCTSAAAPRPLLPLPLSQLACNEPSEESSDCDSGDKHAPRPRVGGEGSVSPGPRAERKPPDPRE
jgi:hypothetical protein